MFRIVYEIAIAVGLLYLVIWLVMTLVGQRRRQANGGPDAGGDSGAYLTHDTHGHDHGHHGHHGMDGGGHGDGGGGGGDGGDSH